MPGRRAHSLVVSLVLAVLAGLAVPGGAQAAAADTGSGVAEQTVDCDALEQERVDFNAGVDQVRAAIQASNLTQAQKDALIAQLEAVRAQGNSQYDLLLVAGGCCECRAMRSGLGRSNESCADLLSAPSPGPDGLRWRVRRPTPQDPPSCSSRSTPSTPS
jgi:hypothetical protein